MENSPFAKIYEEGHADLFPFHLFVDQWAMKLEDKAGENMKTNVAVFRNRGVEWYTNEGEQTRIARNIFNRLMNERLFETVDSKTRVLLDDMLRHIEKIDASDFSKKSDSELLKIHKEYCNKVIELNSWGTLVTLLEMGHESVITKEVYKYLEKKGNEVGAPEKVAESIGILCTPVEDTFLKEKRIGAIRAAQLANEKGIDSSEVKKAIKELFQNFCWVSYGYTGPIVPPEKFKEEITELSKEENLDGILKETLDEMDRIKEEQDELEKFFKFDDYGERLLRMARTFMFQKEYRKQVLYKSFHVLEPMRKELAKRAGASLNQLAYTLPEDLEALLNGEFNINLLNERLKLCVYLAYDRKVLVGKEAEKFTRDLGKGEELGDIKILEGQSAYSARPLTGTVKIVLSAHDAKKLSEGDIIVSPATSPAMVPWLKKVKAIVTDQGGLTCHAAIVARELKKPCVIGTKIATKVLKDGDTIEVDAIKGIVMKI